MYDLIIIGLGPAGINASIYAKRSNLNTLVIEKNIPGGTLNSIKKQCMPMKHRFKHSFLL